MSKNSLLSDTKSITSSELESLLASRKRGEIDFLLVDVRERYEYEDGHIAGVDLLLPTTEFQEWAPILVDKYRDTMLILTCRTANRTGQVQAILLQMGLDRVIDHTGGIMEYSGAIEKGMQGAKSV